MLLPVCGYVLAARPLLHKEAIARIYGLFHTSSIQLLGISVPSSCYFSPKILVPTLTCQPYLLLLTYYYVLHRTTR